MPNYIHWFAYDEMMIPENMKEHGLEYNAAFSVTLSAYRLKFNKIPLDNGGIEGLGQANIVPTSNNLGMMEGMLYEIDEKFLPKIDELYHYPDEYLRKKMRFTKHDFSLVNAVVYMAQKDRTDDSLLPTKEVLKKFKVCKKALTMLYISRLLNMPTLEDQKTES